MIGPRNDDQRIGDFWNALTRGNQADAASLDPSTTELILRLDTLSQTPPPGSARERARQRVFEATPLPKENTMTAITVPSAYPSPNGHGTQPRPAPRTYPTRARPKWAWAALAAALLLVLGGLGSYFGQDGNRPFFGGAPAPSNRTSSRPPPSNPAGRNSAAARPAPATPATPAPPATSTSAGPSPPISGELRDQRQRHRLRLRPQRRSLRHRCRHRRATLGGRSLIRGIQRRESLS